MGGGVAWATRVLLEKIPQGHSAEYSGGVPRATYLITTGTKPISSTSHTSCLASIARGTLIRSATASFFFLLSRGTTIFKGVAGHAMPPTYLAPRHGSEPTVRLHSTLYSRHRLHREVHDSALRRPLDRRYLRLRSPRHSVAAKVSRVYVPARSGAASTPQLHIPNQ